MAAGKGVPGGADRRADQDIGQRRQVVGQVFDRQVALQVLRQQPEHLHVMHFAQQVHLALGVAGGGVQLAPAVAREGGPVGGGLQGALVQHFVEQDRVLGQVFGGPVAGIDHADHALQRVRVFGQQRQIGGAARDRLEEIQQAAEGGEARLRHAGDERQRGIDQRRQPIAAGFGQRLQARRLPGQQQALGSGGGVVEAERGQAGGHRFQRIVVAQRGNRIAAVWRIGGLARLAVAEDGVELGRHQARDAAAARASSAAAVGVAHHLRHAQTVGLIGRQRMGLGVVQILQTMFQVAQESHRIPASARTVGGISKSLASQRAQRGAGRALAQFRLAAAADQLEDLGQEFDFADAAAPQLDVVAALRVARLLARRPRRGSGHASMRIASIDAEIQVAAVNERAHDIVQRRDIGGAAGDGARLDPGVALPFAALHDQVFAPPC